MEDPITEDAHAHRSKTNQAAAEPELPPQWLASTLPEGGRQAPGEEKSSVVLPSGEPCELQ